MAPAGSVLHLRVGCHFFTLNENKKAVAAVVTLTLNRDHTIMTEHKDADDLSCFIELWCREINIDL